MNTRTSYSRLRLLAAVLLASAVAVALTGCGTLSPTRVDPNAVPRPTVDYRLLGACDTVVPPVAENAPMTAYLGSHLATVSKLDACACRYRTLRNLACSLVANRCAPLAECATDPEADTKADTKAETEVDQ